jgi:hypothetical protein
VVAAGFDAVQKVQQIGLQDRLIVGRRHSVDPGRRILGGQPIGLLHPVQIDDVVQREQHSLVSRQFGYPLPFRGQVRRVQGPLLCFPSMALSTRRPPSLHRVPASPVPRLQRYYEVATTSRIRIPGRLCCSLPGSMPPLVHFVSRLRAPAGPGGFRQARGFVQPASQRRCLCQHGRIQDLIGSKAIRSIPLPRLLTPAGSERPRLGGRPDAAPAHRATKAPAFDDFVAIIPWLQYLLPTLHECRCLTHARLASGWLARLCREGIQPSGSLRKVSVRFTSASPFPELAYRGLRASAVSISSHFHLLILIVIITLDSNHY